MSRFLRGFIALVVGDGGSDADNGRLAILRLIGALALGLLIGLILCAYAHADGQV